MSLNLADCSDGELAALTLAGRDAAFAEIMRRHRDPVYRLVRGHVGDADEALDVTQDCFAAAFLALGRYDPERPLRAWLSRIALNKCRDWGRRRAVRRFFAFALPLTDPAATAVADEAPMPDAVAAGRAELDALWKAVSALPANLKEPLVLQTVEGLSQAEAAAVLGISPKAVETRIRRARQRLSETLSQG
ncbi:RNA polymerase subunit sigma-24 [Sphingomonas oleivorans]|uniref:RNA polymerase subunit sigma-24 n=1 Tax=Sphingomonas oleivorans TaxID=1735121 RepID=A0A2T5FZX7_9SPHN|nr:RNA polymerase sigma factor [Sphingomonas oleivorans]PTQ12238.1 RNA polymerase subunit sigma-24 [Sphingomonas oleivorans]